MEIRVTYRVESYIEGNTLRECKDKFERGDAIENDFVELVSVEDAQTYKDLTDRWDALDEGFEVGDRVYWNDPGINDYDPEDRYDVLHRVFIVHTVDNEHGVAYICEEDGGSEAEVFIDELELVE